MALAGWRDLTHVPVPELSQVKAGTGLWWDKRHAGA